MYVVVLFLPTTKVCHELLMYLFFKKDSLQYSKYIMLQSGTAINIFSFLGSGHLIFMGRWGGVLSHPGYFFSHEMIFMLSK